jgi:Kdo2-lipid IVA lauroyltransferase/acyltransferase
VFLDLLLISFIKTFQQFLRLLPERMQASTGASLGRLTFKLLRERRAVAISNVARVFPNLSKKERESIATGCFEKLGINFVESLIVPYISDQERSARFTVENSHLMEEALEQNKGIIALAFHYGNWEILGVITRRLKHEIVALARPMKRHSRLNDFLNSLRSETGLTIISNASAGKEVMRLLRQNRIVAILADQREKRSRGIYVEFFGEKVPTTRGIAMIGMKTGAPVIPVYSVREGFLRYRVVFSPPLVMERNGDLDEMVYRNTRKINAFLEGVILRQPDEWFWVHRRWGRHEKKK